MPTGGNCALDASTEYWTICEAGHVKKSLNAVCFKTPNIRCVWVAYNYPLLCIFQKITFTLLVMNFGLWLVTMLSVSHASSSVNHEILLEHFTWMLDGFKMFVISETFCTHTHKATLWNVDCFGPSRTLPQIGEPPFVDLKHQQPRTFDSGPRRSSTWSSNVLKW